VVAPGEIAARIVASREASDTRRFLGLRLPDFDPSTLLADPQANGVVASYERPSAGLVLVGVGEAGRAECAPGEGPEGLRAAARALLAGEYTADTPELRPRLLGGFAFDGRRPPRAPWVGFAPGALVLPRLLFVSEGGVTGVVIAPGVDPDEVEAALTPPPMRTEAPQELRIAQDVDRAHWLTSVGAVAAAVREGDYEKVVLAASRELDADQTIPVGATLARLRADYPHCHVFSLRTGDATFLGASPELLVSLHDGLVRSLGLAGSARRGADDEEDAAMGQALLDSAKDRIEHETVVRALREGLAPLTAHLHAPNQPVLLKLRNIQHLATDVTAEAAPGVDVLALVAGLHPTPAVCGYPSAAAREVIESHEHFDRGWYAGPVGWMDGNGDGEFAVALRSALVRGQQAWLFAGAGIMGDSVPALELAEIEMKFLPLTNALAGGGAS
jgi:salicylate biosynthesis isochorismate synthase